ncbi:MAG: peroxiredoxin family protein [Vampirovibrionales bacterium]
MFSPRSLVIALLVLATVGGAIGMVFLPSTSPTEQTTSPTDTSRQPSATGFAVSQTESGFERLKLLAKGIPAPVDVVETAEGKPFSVQDAIGKHAQVLVFYQGVFCSVCQHQLESIQAKLDTFKKRGIQVAAISADDLADAKKRQGESGLTYPVIHDEKRTLIQAFGVANITRKNIAYPTVYFLDKEGRVLDVYADAEMQRLEADGILKHLDSLGL